MSLGRAPLLPRRRYGKPLKWRGRDEWGELEVVEGELGLELHFGSSALQGRINLEQPWRPLAEYAVSMLTLAALPERQSRQDKTSLQVPDRPRVCLLGLGTGSLAWSYHRILPQAELTAIELRPGVIEVATQLFGLGSLTALRIIQGDASRELVQLADHSQTLVAIDLFTSTGMAPCLSSSDLWREVSRVLHPCGAIAVNSWSGDAEAFEKIFTEIKAHVCPQGDALIIDHEGFGNYIVLASPRPLDREGCLTRATQIDQLLNEGTPQAHSYQSRRGPKKRDWESAAEEAGLSGEGVRERLRRAWKRAQS